MAKTLGSLSVGDKVKIGRLYNKPIIWKVSDKGHAGYPANSVSLITERIVKIAAFDGKEASSPDGNRRSYGNNRYSLSNLFQWLNSDKAAGSWYTAKHSTDAPPTKANCANYNGYDTVAGFLNEWSADDKAALLDTTVVVNKASVDGGGQETVTGKINLLSYAEVGLAGDTTEGSVHALFASGGHPGRVAMPTAEAVANSDYVTSSLNVSGGWYWWCRSPYVSVSYNVRSVYTDGSANNYLAYYGNWGVRPACNLQSVNLVSDSPDADGCYTMIYNQPPIVPGYITVPATIAGGLQLTIPWGESTDPEGKSVSYRLERSIDNGSWAQIYTGAAHEYTDTAQIGATTIRYQVKAVDADGIQSAYRTSTAISVTQKQPPAVSGAITIPTEVIAGNALTIQWDPSIDPDGGVVTYALERLVDEGAWAQVYAGENTSYNDTAPQGATTLQYRVRAKDSVGLYSGYKTSTVINVSNNMPPTISGTDTDMGLFSDSFPGYNYTVNDADSSSVTVQEIIDNAIFRTYTPVLGNQQTFALEGVDWYKISNGNHTVRIVATDDEGESNTRTISFFKDVDTVEFYTSKLNADAMPVSILVNVQGAFPSGSILTVLASNDADDDSPIWQDVTSKLGSKAIFTNDQKTAATWSVQLHVTLQRGTATLPCYISSVGGGFA